MLATHASTFCVSSDLITIVTVVGILLFSVKIDYGDFEMFLTMSSCTR